MSEPLKTVSAKEVASKFGYYTDEAMLHPVGIQRHGTTRVVMLSLKEYERLLRRDRQVLLVKDLDDETIEAIRNAEPSERSKELGRSGLDAYHYGNARRGGPGGARCLYGRTEPTTAARAMREAVQPSRPPSPSPAAWPRRNR